MLNEVIFYTLEKAIKRYRQFAQAGIDRRGIDITIDQWLVLNVIRDMPDVGQMDIAEQVFKDQASIARIIELLVKKGLLDRTTSLADRRKLDMKLTESGCQLIADVAPAIAQNRMQALSGLDEAVVEQLKCWLEIIFLNCSIHSSESTQQLHDEHA
ncbi:transcriptional regulator, MarR family [Fibrisoma limi BUZ 3]|uniref:Transcriptional regulator, MarR family n=1 Tax=Fibrisoma limi BUZ 3 TaxID=1185876 RepID=I2GLG2_9BACT|nr:MarR family transcriptional regulator [Fibrisoma limi]CCH54738.1 transcriptional regulator, MarR family [Fibrisoma limi BUZ 3]